MSDTDEHDQNADAGLDISDEDAERLLSDAVDGDEDDGNELDGSSQRNRPDKGDRASEELLKWRSLARKHEREAKARGAKLKEFEDANKSESQRLQDSALEYKTRADKSEAELQRVRIALSVAPEHASFPALQKVLKRMAGSDDEELEEDARELWADYAPAPPKESPKAPAPTGRPKERLRPGNADPEEDDEEEDPRKLAAAIRRNR